jgi:hypothetical protein
MVVSREHRCRQLFAASHFFQVENVIVLTSENRSGCFFLQSTVKKGNSAQSPLKKRLVNTGLSFRRESTLVRSEALGR